YAPSMASDDNFSDKDRQNGRCHDQVATCCVPGSQAAPEAPASRWPGGGCREPGSSGGAPTGQLTLHSGLTAGSARSTSLRMVSSESTAPSTSKPALVRIASWKPCRNIAGCACASPVSPASGGIAATNSSDAARATALLTPLAM